MYIRGKTLLFFFLFLLIFLQQTAGESERGRERDARINKRHVWSQCRSKGEDAEGQAVKPARKIPPASNVKKENNKS